MRDQIVGNGWLINASFGPTGAYQDPGGPITVTVTDPKGNVTTNAIVKNGTGVYEPILTQYCDVAGVWEAVVSAPPTSGLYGSARVTWTVAPA